jgi:hypothetical protein
MKLVAVLLTAALLLLGGCKKSPKDGPAPEVKEASANPAPTNRVDIPAAVRRNLGITFATVERRNVAKTLRLPGRFELLPTATREYRTPVGGRVELLVTQYQRVEAGTPLYRVDSAAWRDLHEQLAATQAKVDSMKPLREAHRVHERSLADKVQIWEERVRQLAELRAVGGGGASQFTEARATLNATQAELADTMEKDAALEADEKVARAQLRSLQSRHDGLVASGGEPHAHDHQDSSQGQGAADVYSVRAVAPGVVDSVHVTVGGLAEESGLIVTVVQPEQLRFRASALQTDLGRLREGLPARIVPPAGGTLNLQDAMIGSLTLGLRANPDERTVELLVRPDSISPWARAGISAHVEVTLEGGGEELAIPLSCVTRDGTRAIIFRRDPANPDKAIRMDADVGVHDGRWVVIGSGVKEGDEIVLDGVYQLMLATAGGGSKAGHFHSDGTFHEGEDK